jgi:hypothetical protein
VTFQSLPDGTVGEAGVCRSCRAAIVWVTTRNGRLSPMNLDGSSHFGTCPQSEKWRRRGPGPEVIR